MAGLRDDALHRLGSLVVQDNAALGLLIDTRYRVTRRIARGGMGEVFLAEDTRLGRPVAMKILAQEMVGSALTRRFELEARTISRIEHPGIVPVHDLGALPDGRLYYTMKFISGRTLEEYLKEDVGRTRRLEILATTCDIVDHAHRHGVVHRDLKPANIMVDDQGQVYVLDWGIARVKQEFQKSPLDLGFGSDGFTRVGDVLGTLFYMAPEQARGEESIDRRTDVYSLGAILYEILTGTPPIRGRSLDTLLEAAKRAEPILPRELVPAVSAELEAICLRALAGKREARYDGAGDLGTDLRRFLGGDPVRAFRGGIGYRVRKRLSQHRLAAALAGVAVLVGGAAATYILADPTERQLRESRKQQVLQMREATEGYLAAALVLRREGKPAEMELFARKTEQACLAVIREQPALAEPHYRLGLMHRARLDWRRALAAQEQALIRDPNFVPARFERGRLLLRAYADRSALLRAQWVREESLRSSGRRGGLLPLEVPKGGFEDGEMQTLRRRALEDLQAVPTTSARALATLLRGEDSILLFERAVREDPTFEEAYEMLSRFSEDRGDWEGAVTWFSRGIARDRGFLPFHRKRAAARIHQGHFRSRTGADSVECYRAAVEELADGLSVDSGCPELWRLKGMALYYWGQGEIFAGRDPSSVFRRAIAALEQESRINAQDAEARSWRGMVGIAWAVDAEDRGGDPTTLYEGAIREFDAALLLDSGRGSHWCGRGLARINWADRLREIPRAGGPTPESLLAAALEDFRQALSLEASDPDARLWRGMAFSLAGMLEVEKGRDPSPRWKEAIEDLSEAVRLLRFPGQALLRRGTARSNLALYQGQHLQDPSQQYRLALEDFDASLKWNEKDFNTWRERGICLLNRGTHEWNTKRAPGPSFSEAVANLTRSIQLHSANPKGWLIRGNIRAAWLDYTIQTSTRRPEEIDLVDSLITACDEDFSQAIRLRPENPEAWWKRGHARAVSGANREAIEDFRKAAGLDPRSRDYLQKRIGESQMALEFARTSHERGEEHFQASRYREALSEFLKAVRNDAALRSVLDRKIEECRRRVGE